MTVLLLISGSPATADDLTIYADSIASSWDDWSWDTTVNPACISPVHAGSSSIAVTFNAAWAGFYLHASSVIDASGYDKLRFWIHGGAGSGRSLRIVANGSASVAITAQSGTWTQIIVPLSDLGSPASFSSPGLLTAWEVPAGKETGKDVLVLGGGMVGVETAELLSQRGCLVTVVEMLDSLAADMEGTTRTLLLERISASKISVLLSTRVMEVQEGRVLLRKEGGEEWLSAETIVLALGSQANNEFLNQLTDKFPEVIAIGDCVQPRKAKEAIHEGFLAGLKI